MSRKATDQVTTIGIAMSSDATNRSVPDVRAESAAEVSDDHENVCFWRKIGHRSLALG